MITNKEVMPLVLESCQSFADVADAVVSIRDEDTPLLEQDLRALADHLIESYRTGWTQEFDALFKVIEELLCNGDGAVQRAVTEGLLEGLQDISTFQGLNPDIFVPFLGPESIKVWVALKALF